MASCKLTLVLILLAALATSFVSADPFRCYSCTSCDSVDSKTATVDCDGERKCYISGDPDKEKWSRGCGPANYCDQHAKSKDVACSQCGENECNAAAWTSGGLLLTAAAAGVAIAAVGV